MLAGGGNAVAVGVGVGVGVGGALLILAGLGAVWFWRRCTSRRKYASEEAKQDIVWSGPTINLALEGANPPSSHTPSSQNFGLNHSSQATSNHSSNYCGSSYQSSEEERRAAQLAGPSKRWADIMPTAWE